MNIKWHLFAGQGELFSLFYIFYFFALYYFHTFYRQYQKSLVNFSYKRFFYCNTVFRQEVKALINNLHSLKMLKFSHITVGVFRNNSTRRLISEAVSCFILKHLFYLHDWVNIWWQLYNTRQYNIRLYWFMNIQFLQASSVTTNLSSIYVWWAYMEFLKN